MIRQLSARSRYIAKLLSIPQLLCYVLMVVLFLILKISNYSIFTFKDTLKAFTDFESKQVK